MQTFPTKSEQWYSGGDLYGVFTTQQPGESHEHFCARHDEAVALAKSIWPPD